MELNETDGRNECKRKGRQNEPYLNAFIKIIYLYILILFWTNKWCWLMNYSHIFFWEDFIYIYIVHFINSISFFLFSFSFSILLRFWNDWYDSLWKFWFGISVLFLEFIVRSLHIYFWITVSFAVFIIKVGYFK